MKLSIVNLVCQCDNTDCELWVHIDYDELISLREEYKNTVYLQNNNCILDTNKEELVEIRPNYRIVRMKDRR